MNYTYILKCSDETFYTGWTNHLEKRIENHNNGKGAKYTRGRTPVCLAYYEAFATKEEAMRREWEIKQMSRKEKLELMVHHQEKKKSFYDKKTNTFHKKTNFSPMEGSE